MSKDALGVVNANTPWFQEWFGEDYLLTYPHRSAEQAAAEIDSLLKVLPLNADSLVLDVACGAGRHLSRLKQRGFQAIGIDLSQTLLQKALAIGTAFAQADMRALPFRNESVHAVISFFTSFGYFESTVEDQLVLQEISRVLVPQGYFCFDTAHKAYVIKNLVPSSQRTEISTTIEEKRSFDAQTNRVTKHIKLRDSRGQRNYAEIVHLYEPQEIRTMLIRQGLTLVKEFGDYDLTPFGTNSPRYFVIAQKETS